MSIARERFGKQISTAMNTQATIEDLLGTMFSIRFGQSDCKEEFRSE
jgi:hypothetical protein